MTTNETVFQEAKAIAQQLNRSSVEFSTLADYIAKRWNIKLIHGDVYEYIQLSNPMQLRLIFETQESIHPLPTLWTDRQVSIGKRFKEILVQNKIHKYKHFDLSNLTVEYFAFDELAYLECLQAIDYSCISTEYEKYSIRDIQFFWNYFTVFYPTNTDLAHNEQFGVNDKIQQRFQELAILHDTFSTLQNRKVKVLFDSMENYNQAGSRYNYYR